ncbi:MAG TPA: bifunctional demethylmenaquinone methyltransferase/2-methoxy-6-polyprenyl-1,4-benzoquinol methylase UbiE [Spirochaetota bacterium]|nr:bifunctional demethylmenaquinone methyltransferase/2-methoxy-6-polyprenyl-1,4-benzoquinol methylase UbiE [Spirochaetota bacterium]
MNYSRYEINNTSPWEKKRYIRSMFDSIVPTYDLLNRILSFGIDNLWRRDLVKIASVKDKRVLDLCCGTGDLTRQIIKSGGDVISLDFSFNMLKKGKKKGWLSGENISADACTLPFKSNIFDVLTIAFGIRNIPDIDVFLKESLRVLKPNGKLLILELTRPDNSIVRFFYNLYLGKILPFIGGIISGKDEAYSYLAGSISTFLEREMLIQRIKNSGFTEVSYKKKTFGIATIYICKK